MDGAESFLCSCTAGHTGDFCEENVDEHLNNDDCEIGASSVDGVQSIQ